MHIQSTEPARELEVFDNRKDITLDNYRWGDASAGKELFNQHRDFFNEE